MIYRNRKKAFAFACALLLTGSLVSCNGNDDTGDTDVSSDAADVTEPSSADEKNIIATGYVSISDEYAELKEKPDSASPTVARVYDDYKVIVYKLENNWVYCNCGGLDGYLSAEYVQLGENKPNPVTTETTSVTTVTQTTADIRVNENLTDIDYYVNSYAYAKVDSSLIIRSGPSTDYKNLGEIKRGDSMYVYYAMTNSRGYKWYYVNVGNINGYVLAKYTTFDYDEIYPNNYYSGYVFDAYVSTKQGSDLNLRDTPNGKVIKSIPNNSYVTVYDTSDSKWWYICYNGTYGYASSDYLHACSGGIEKPVIYLYPEKETEVSINLEISNGELMFTYPEYKNGWNVTAYPDSTIKDSKGGKYSYIFWDAEINEPMDFSTGFVVEGKDTLEFLNEKLEYMGLNENEKNEFIVYWVPRMMKNRYNLISFQMENYEEMAKLTVNPKPDSMLRVFMAFKPLDEKISVPEQKLDRFERKGFALVEWGGCECR